MKREKEIRASDRWRGRARWGVASDGRREIGARRRHIFRSFLDVLAASEGRVLN